MTENTGAGGILGIIGTLVGVLVGAVLTYFISLRVRKKERLIDGIYTPLLGQLGSIAEQIRNGHMPDLKGLEEARRNGLYFVMDRKVQNGASEAYLNLIGYHDAYNESTRRSKEIVREEVRKLPETYREREPTIIYRAFSRHQHIEVALRIGKTPLQILYEKKPELKDSDITCLLGGQDFERSLADSIAELALKRANEDSAILEDRLQRQSLLADLQELIEMLKKRVI